jgi:hypothetical protein
MPTFFFQSSVGLYLLVTTMVLILIVNQLDSNSDQIHVQYELGTTVMSAMTKYSSIVAIGILIFSYVGGSVLSTLA